MSGFLELFSQYDVLGAFLVNIEPATGEAVMELLRILETPVGIRVVMALSLAMMLAVVLGLA